MKKKMLVCLCVGVSTLLLGVGSSFAAVVASSQASTTDGGKVTLGAVGTQLTYDPSPSVLMSVKASTSAYAIMATNAVTDKTNGKEYGTVSTATGYAQRTKTVDAATAVPVPKDETTLPTTNGAWTWMGGS